MPYSETWAEHYPDGTVIPYMDKKAREAIGEGYNPPYSAGQAIMYEGITYVANTAIASDEIWTPSHWTASNVCAMYNELKSNLDDKLGWYRPDSTVDTLAKFCSYIDDLLGSGSGYRTGYIGSTVAQRIGLSNEGYYYEAKANSENYRIVMVNNASGSLYKTLAKAGGTWQTAWKGVTLS